MKKSLIALAACGLCAGVAQAQVTVYGTMDLSMQSINNAAAAGNATSAGSAFKMNSSTTNTSNFGIRGVEDIGGGLMTIFDLEAQLAANTGAAPGTANYGTTTTLSTTGATSNLFSRGAYVGLKSNSWGTVTLGRNYTSAFISKINSNAIITGPNTGLVTATAAQGLANDYWNNNQVKYESPVMNGFSFAVNYAADGIAGDNSQGTNMGGSLTWSGNGLTISAGGQQDKGATGTYIAAAGGTSFSDVGKSVKWYFANVSYAWDKFRIVAGWDSVKNPDSAGGAALGNAGAYAAWLDSRLLTVGASYQATPQLGFAAQYYAVKLTSDGTISSQTILNADYKFSKRTSAYALVGFAKNKSLSLMPIYGTVAAANTNSTGVAVGLLHRF
ncbi:MAG: porin [Candidatus Protistobacter heckmanni]|nr:porin [Candidatus Protistobacter heckmanni]